MKKEFEQYFENLNRIWNISKPNSKQAASEAEWLNMIQENANETRRLRMENQDILNKNILYFDKHVEELSEEAEQELFEFTNSLMQFQKQADLGLAYHIHSLLLQYARLHNDTDRIIRESYHAGLCLYYITRTSDTYGMDLYRKEAREYFECASSYLSQMNQFSSKETRGYILRSLANIRLTWPAGSAGDDKALLFHTQEVGIEERRAYNRKLVEIFTDPKLQKENPDLPWDSFIYALHFGRSALLSFLRAEDNPELAAEVLESMTYVYEKNRMEIERSNEMWSARLVYVYHAARYHAKQITLMELLDLLYTEHEKADIDDWSGDGVYRSLNLMNYIREYAKGCTEEEREQLKERAIRANDYCWRYIRRLPLGEFLNVVTNFIRDMSAVFDETSDMNEYSNYLLNYILACHQPTYVHSLMVAYLSRVLCERLLKVRPEYFIGMPGIDSLSDVEINHAQILRFVYDCGLYHDIGKGSILNFVGIYGRKLFDEEFAILQIHPYIGYITMKNFANSRQIEDAALGHHKWYDDTKGYPNYFDTKNSPVKRVIDIISVADSMDAATDNVGRSYAEAKTLQELVDEFKGFRGDRYAPEVVDILLDETYLNELSSLMKRERNRSYLVVYRNEQISDRYEEKNWYEEKNKKTVDK